MEEDRFTKAKRAEGRAGDDAGWSPGVGQIVGLVLCAILLLATIILGVTTGIGFVFAIPLVLLVVVVFVVLFRGKPERAATVCPNCNARVNAPAHIAEFNCPACGSRLEVGAGGDVRRLT
jgi:DNA-directed RNA polymerase subunit RPC12/RpoP